jgi:hypothetical protein
LAELLKYTKVHMSYISIVLWPVWRQEGINGSETVL